MRQAEHFQPFKSLVTAVWSEAVAVKRYYEIGIEIQDGCQLILHRIDGEIQRLSLLIGEFHIGVFEVEQGGGVCAVVNRSGGLHLEVSFYDVIGVFRHSQKNAAVNPFVDGILVVGEMIGIHVFRDGFLQRLEHILAYILQLVGVDCHLAIEFLSFCRPATYP